MKKFLIITLLSIGLISCSACAKKNPEPTAPAPTASSTAPNPPPPPTTVTVAKDNWQIVLPDNGWSNVSSPPNSTAFINMGRKNILVVISEEFDGKMDDYVILSMRGARDAGATIVSAKQIDLNGHKFVLVESSKNNTYKIWMWITVNKGHGYGFSCGGPLSEENIQKDLCSGIASTFKIN